MSTPTPSKASSEAVPSTFWQTTINEIPNQLSISLPKAGLLVVTYTPQQPAKDIYVLHRDNSHHSIQPGVNNVVVEALDEIIWIPFNMSFDVMKLAYEYAE
jgi:hypothetical protein